MIGIMTNLYFLYFCYDKSSIILNGGMIFIEDFIYCFVCCQKNYCGYNWLCIAFYQWMKTIDYILWYFIQYQES
jgi:hypothetical protein